MQNIMTSDEGLSADMEKLVHKTVKKVGEDFERMKFNTAIAAMMTFLNEVTKKGSITKGEYKVFITLLNPVAPHMTEELWEMLGGKGLLSLAPWPEYDEAKTVDDEVEIVVQINGKIRDKAMVPADLDRNGLTELAMNSEKIQALTEGKEIIKVLAVPGRLINIVVKG